MTTDQPSPTTITPPVLAAVRAFARGVHRRAHDLYPFDESEPEDTHCYALIAELAALELRVAQAQERRPGVGRTAVEQAEIEDGRY